MIKVLVPGTTCTTQCNHCSAVLRYDAEDVQDTMITANNGNVYHKINSFIICPQCENKIILKGMVM